jgi:hypothetical protein
MTETESINVTLLQKFAMIYEKKNYQRCTKTTINEIVEDFIPDHSILYDNADIRLLLNESLKCSERRNAAFLKKLLNYINKIHGFNLPNVKHIKNCRKKNKDCQVTENKENPKIKSNQKIGYLPIDYIFNIKWKGQDKFESIIGNNLKDALSRNGYDLDLLSEIATYNAVPYINQNSQQYLFNIILVHIGIVLSVKASLL